MTCNIGENSTLVANMVNLFQADDFGLAKDLESIDFGVELMIEGNMSA